jgi:hypothetical protein
MARAYFVACLLLSPLLTSAWQICDITSYGAKGDNATLNTYAFSKAIAACQAGGTIKVPAPGTFLTGPMNLTSNMVLLVEKGATILGTNDPKQYPLMAPFPSMGGDITRDGHPCRYGPLVGAVNATNITITGGGVIDGQGAWWWEHGSKLQIERPRLVELQHVIGLTISAITLQNSVWHSNLYFPFFSILRGAFFLLSLFGHFIQSIAATSTFMTSESPQREEASMVRHQLSFPTSLPNPSSFTPPSAAIRLHTTQGAIQMVSTPTRARMF